jgi:hypothetical protein
MSKAVPISLLILLLSFMSCDKGGNSGDIPETGKIKFGFYHRYNIERLYFDTLKYTNTAGNLMVFNEIQYFISDVVLHYNDGSTYQINKWKDIHYVDSDIPATQTWSVYDSIPPGYCDSITFTFGINEAKNKSYIFVNPPESLMFWPDTLGGGYHYLKLNGKWLNDEQQLSPFNFHLGIGQVYDAQGNIVSYVQNYFTVSLTNYPFEIQKGSEIYLPIVMNVESWFDTPDIFDFNTWGGDIMQKQDAMHVGCKNGKDAFHIDVLLYIQQ